MTTVAFDQRKVRKGNWPPVASGRETVQAWIQEGRDHLGAGAKIRLRVRLEYSSQSGEGKVVVVERGDAEPLALQQVYWVSFV